MLTSPAHKGRSRLGSAREERFEQILTAAAAAYASLGYHQTSVKAIVDGAGVATGTYYLYFPNKAASCLAVIDRLYELVMAAVITGRSGCTDVSQKLAASIDAVLNIFGQQEQLAKVVLIQAPGAHPLFDDRLRLIHAKLTTLVAEDLREAIADGLIPDQDEDVVARCLVGSLYEVLIGWLRDRNPTDLTKAKPTLMRYVMRGIGLER